MVRMDSFDSAKGQDRQTAQFRYREPESMIRGQNGIQRRSEAYRMLDVPIVGIRGSVGRRGCHMEDAMGSESN